MRVLWIIVPVQCVPPAEFAERCAAAGRREDVLLDLFFPPVCPGCGVLPWEARGGWCRGCEAQMVAVPQGSVRGGAIGSLFGYDGPLGRALGRLKYQGEPAWAGPLGRLLGQAPDLRADAGWDLVIPVPLHLGRRLARGFNQTELLLRHALRDAGRSHRRRLQPGLLRRDRSTPPQVSLGASRRLANVVGAFSVPARLQPRVRERSVLVVDDVTTTGATLTACRTALLEAGAAEVGALALLRTLA